jgi:hypothetical protein
MLKSSKRMVMTVGDSRVGKSTVMKLLLEIYQLQGKRLKVYDHDNRDRFLAYKDLVCIEKIDFFNKQTDRMFIELVADDIDIILVDMPGQHIDKICQYIVKQAESMHYTVVSSAVRDEMKKIKPISTGMKVQSGWGLGTVSLVCGLVAAGSTLLGSLTTWNLVQNVGTNQSVVVSRNEIKILQWAKSQEGKQMYQIILKNQAAIEACQTQQSKTQGYCLIQVGK